MSKMAKCEKYKYSFCTHKHDAPECTNCVLVIRRENMYKWINGQKYKRCPHCTEYKPLSEFKTNARGDKSWCTTCHRAYAREKYYNDGKSFMISHRVGEKKVHVKFDSVPKMIKFVRNCVHNNERFIEIKRI